MCQLFCLYAVVGIVTEWLLLFIVLHCLFVARNATLWLIFVYCFVYSFVVVNAVLVIVCQTWSTPAGRQPKLILRGEPVVVKRVPSVFAVEKEEAAKTEDGQLGDSQAMDREERGEAGKDREERGGAGKDREERGGAGKDGEERAGEGKLYDSDIARDSSSDDETKVVNMEDGREEEYIDYDWEVRG